MTRGYLKRQQRRQQKHYPRLQRLQLMQSWSHGSCGSRSKCSHRQEGASCQKLQLQLQSRHLKKRQQQLQRSRCGGSCHSCHHSTHARTHGCSCCHTHGRSHLQSHRNYISIACAACPQPSESAQSRPDRQVHTVVQLHMAACLAYHDEHSSIKGKKLCTLPELDAAEAAAALECLK